MGFVECETCDPCIKRLEVVKEKCSLNGIKVNTSEKEYWLFCFALKALIGLEAAGKKLEVFEWLAAKPIPPKRRKDLITYVISRFPSAEVQIRFLELARQNFPEIFDEGLKQEDVDKVLKKIRETRRDASAAAFLLKAEGYDVELPDYAESECLRIQYETFVYEYALKTQGNLVDNAVQKACSGRDKVISQYRKKFEKTSKIIAQKISEAEKYKKEAAVLRQKLKETEAYYQTEIKKLHEEIAWLKKENGELKEKLAFLENKKQVSVLKRAVFPKKKVLIIGDPTKKASYEEALGRLGIELRFIDGIDKNCNPVIARNTDLVVIVGDYGKHSVLEKVKPEAKKHGVPVITVPSGGVSTVVSVVKQKFIKNSKNVKEERCLSTTHG